MKKNLAALTQDNEDFICLIEKMSKDVLTFLKDRGIRGIFIQSTPETDRIYGYEYDGEDNLIELEVKAIMLNENGTDYCFLVDSPMISYTKESVLSSFADDSDDSLSHWDVPIAGNGLGVFTLINIVESLYEYDKKGNYIY